MNQVTLIRRVAMELDVRVQVLDKEKEGHKDFFWDWRLPRAVLLTTLE